MAKIARALSFATAAVAVLTLSAPSAAWAGADELIAATDCDARNGRYQANGGTYMEDRSYYLYDTVSWSSNGETLVKNRYSFQGTVSTWTTGQWVDSPIAGRALCVKNTSTGQILDSWEEMWEDW
ncbi:hypothetical protein [Nonomuraea pusilla]|uniref:Secreted protein n=1 Tax=Nonomuraea pusilla TaxID=46177 RepID=A0A1H7WUC4_9ACTN|nr:hypothetical protein [Nonomuraea pusilla]SEM25210.1 hypothetical protein SAMN05660976_04607 [Nonomuraea pusilla]